MTAQPLRKLYNKVPPPEDTSGPAVYVTRLPEPSRRFVWDIRRLSAVVLERSREDFATADLAREDGQTALSVMLAVA